MGNTGRAIVTVLYLCILRPADRPRLSAGLWAMTVTYKSKHWFLPLQILDQREHYYKPTYRLKSNQANGTLDDIIWSFQAVWAVLGSELDFPPDFWINRILMGTTYTVVFSIIFEGFTHSM